MTAGPGRRRALAAAATLAAGGLLAVASDLSAQGRSRPFPEERARLQYVTTVRQLGPVAYRDPLGVISPDGEWLAFTSGRRLARQRIDGGPVAELGRAEGRFTAIAWLPDSRFLAAREESFDRGRLRWYVYDSWTGKRAPLFADGFELQTTGGQSVLRTPGANDRVQLIQRFLKVKAEEFARLAWSPNGRRVAGIKHDGKRSEVWLFDSESGNAQARDIERVLTYPTWQVNSADVACLSMSGRDIHSQLEFSCGGTVTGGFSPVAYGPFAFSPDGRRLYYAAPNEMGTLDLFVRGVPETGANPRSAQLTRFTRDTYAPSVSRSGRILFKTQDYKAHIAYVEAAGGPTRAITTFQSETPSWDPSGTRISFTFGSWRRAADDLRYPDIAQHVGYVTLDGTLPESEPGVVVRASESEDQGMHWSPNGKWIALHSHADDSDDIWIQPSSAGRNEARRISDDGHETGWPRWSPDGRWIVYPSFKVDDDARQGVLYIVGVDQETGEVTVPQRQVPLEGFAGIVSNAEWSPDSEQLVFGGDDGSGTQAIYVVPRVGGAPRKIHEFQSEQLFSGIGVSPDFEWVAYCAPDDQGYFQIWRVPMAGGEPEQLTTDPTDKAHPAYSPDASRIALTVFNYEAIFWMLEP